MAALHAHTHATLAGLRKKAPLDSQQRRACLLLLTENTGAPPLGRLSWEVHPHSPFRRPWSDVDWGARRTQFLGEDVHPQLYLALKQR